MVEEGELYILYWNCKAIDGDIPSPFTVKVGKKISIKWRYCFGSADIP